MRVRGILLALLMAQERLSSRHRRVVLEQLTRDRLAELTSRFELDVVDRRSTDSHIEAIIRKRSLDFALVLEFLKREELQAACEALGLDAGGREKSKLAERILGKGAGERNPNGDEDGDGDGAADDHGTDGFALSSPRPKASGGRTRAAPRTTTTDPVTDYRYTDASRTNNPPAGLVEFDKPPPKKSRHYTYDPHLDPQLVWAGKQERTAFDVDTVSLHIHERVSTQAILRAVKREDAQRSLFADNDLPEGKAIEFYSHDVGWSNRLVLGDSLVVMNSLLERERMAGKVQCVYMDPPYGVRFNSNFQPSISRREVKDGDDASLTREPEQIQAYRDTWELGIHSYLTYMRDRLFLCRELLGDSGSIFVQISDENLHHVRELMDEIFGASNFVVVICYRRLGMMVGQLLQSSAHYLVWYAKDKERLKYRKLFLQQVAGVGSGDHYTQLEHERTGEVRPMTAEERTGVRALSANWRPFQLVSLATGGYRPNTTINYVFEGKTYHPGSNKCWRTTREGLDRLASVGRIQKAGETIRYKQYLDDFPLTEATTIWDDTARDPENLYVVQTPSNIIRRCILMTTDPGDLVLDPTCGSGTTAFVAEQWGRRWISCDTSRVALSLARQRLLTARFPYYRLRSDRVRDGFVYQTVPHITLGGIANNSHIESASTRIQKERVIRESAEQEVLYDQPMEDKGRVRVSGPFTVEAIPVATLEDPNSVQEGDESGNTPPSAMGRVADPAGDYLTMMLDLVRKSGVQFAGSRHLKVPSIRAVKGPYEYLHAEAESDMEGDPRRIAISFGPKHAPVTPMQVRDALTETRGYDWVIFIGFGCDPEARRMIDQGVHGRQLDFANAAPDILVGDLLKTTKATKLFTVFGAPDVRVHKEGDGLVSVELTGVDLYDPITGSTNHGKGDDVAAWFLDHDYDGRSFCICQALFPGRTTKNPWEKLQKALKGTIDEEKFEQLRTTRSLPFKAGKKVAVTVIDDRGNEVIKVVDTAKGTR